MEHFVNNSDTLKDLQVKKGSDHNIINVYLIANYAILNEKKHYEEDSFSLKVQVKKEGKDEVTIVEVKDLRNDSSLQGFYEKIEKLTERLKTNPR